MLKTHFYLAIILFFVSCSPTSETTISGNIDYLGGTEFYAELHPMHYKYSPKERFPISVNNGKFEISIPITTPQVVTLTIQDETYPLFVTPSEATNISIKRADFPMNVEVNGVGTPENEAYQQFLKNTSGLQTAINAEMDKYKVGETNNALQLTAQKTEAAKTYLKETGFNDLYLKTIGEELVLKLRAVEYSARHEPDFDADAARQKVLEDALEADFFRFESLLAQRAGIRDFTHYYSRTFGIYDSVLQKYGSDLAEYDIKRLAYPELNEKRKEVLMYIAEPKAKAYAELFLLAERIGEVPLEWAEPSYQEYINSYQSEYPEFVEFITWFYEEIKSVSPGQPAIPFSISDRQGEIHTLNDYSGKFVLLDFWAGWCQPCLEEFPYMREIYQTYSRDEFEILGISTEIDSLVWIQDITRFKNPWPQLYGGNGFNQETFKAYKGGGIPFYILVDPNGNIARYNDVRPSFNFTQVLDSLLLDYNQH